MSRLPAEYADLFADETKALGFLATVMDDGTPQVTPVWFDTEGDVIRVNTAVGRVKERNLRARPYAAIAIVDPQNPYRYVQIRGPVTLSEEGADEHIDCLAQKYLGQERYPWRAGETRIIARITPEHVQTMG